MPINPIYSYNDKSALPGRTSSHADCMACTVCPAWVFSAMQMYSPASSKVMLDRWRVFTLDDMFCRGCVADYFRVMRREHSAEDNTTADVSRSVLTVRALRPGGPPWFWPGSLTFTFSHCTFVLPGLWTLHINFAWPPTTAVVFSG